eukprot:12820036-Alexandrium_andersonii.AAC.1
MARRVLPNSTPLSRWSSKPGARCATSGRPSPRIGPNRFSAQPRTAPTWGHFAQQGGARVALPEA